MDIFNAAFQKRFMHFNYVTITGLVNCDILKNDRKRTDKKQLLVQLKIC